MNSLHKKEIQTIFEQRCQASWFIGLSWEAWIEQTQRYLHELSKYTAENLYPRIMLAHSDPTAFLAGFMAAAIAECPVFLGNPNWSTQEWQQVAALTQPHLFWGNLPSWLELSPSNTIQAQERGWILIPTGGTSGVFKFAIHTWDTLSCAVNGFSLHFFGNTTPIHSCCCLPLYHVSGLMQFMRSLLTGGQFVLLASNEVLMGSSHNPERNDFLNTSFTTSNYFLSLVPTQLWRLLQEPARTFWLQQFYAILLGGSVTTPDLLQQARNYSLNLAPTYGMTEMASQVATLLPTEFLQGRQGVGRTLPHAEVSILSEDNQPLPLEQVGKIIILSSAAFQGYYPQLDEELWYFQTGDIGYFDAEGFLHILGRSDRRITTGGEKVFPEEVEAAIRATGLVADVYVMGVPDAEWGQAIAAFYVPIESKVTEAILREAIANQLSSYKHPKQWRAVAHIPRNAQGKIKSDALINMPLL